MSIPPSPVELGARKIDMVEILYCTKMANYIQFGAECWQKYRLYGTKLPVEVV